VAQFLLYTIPVNQQEVKLWRDQNYPADSDFRDNQAGVEGVAAADSGSQGYLFCLW
jgi:hypothetical protein